MRSTTPSLRRPASLVPLCFVLCVSPLAAQDQHQAGATIYAETCARCHGADGQGTDDYPDPLVGELSVAQLTRRIERTMPEDDPGTCVGDDAAAVAAFLHQSFYSPVARERNRPARIDLSRLTVRQYRNTIADLLGDLREGGGGVWIARDRGLTGQYYDARRFRDDRKQIERVDPQVNFDFGTEGPAPAVLDPAGASIRMLGSIPTVGFGRGPYKAGTFVPRRLAIRWRGSVIAPETGTYEFILKTNHSGRVFVNSEDEPLVDAYVKSGDGDEYRGSLDLLAGRAYPIRLEFSTSERGVEDRDADTAPPPDSRVALEWVPPRGVRQPVPTRSLTPQNRPPVFVMATPFPPDDRSVGYERGAAVSKAWDEATTAAAIEVGAHLAAHPSVYLGVDSFSDQFPARARDFAARFAERAFRRPLSDHERALYVDRQFDATADPATALRRTVLLTLKSPRFLYPDLAADPDAWSTAAELALVLWDSLPDDELRRAAAEGRLATREQRVDQARRMLDDPRCRSKLRDFLFQWLKVEPAPELAKDAETYADFDAELAADLRTSLELFLDESIWAGTGDFRHLFLADELPLNGRLARYYGAELPPESDFQATAPAAGQRAGVLTHPYLLSHFAYTSTTSPIHRGVFLARNVLGVGLKPPPDAFTPLPPGAHPDLTTRERVDLQTSPPACVACHGLINPLGYPLEAFDAVGRWREEESGRPIDATGFYETRDGRRVTFDGPGDLGRFLAASPEVHEAFATQLFHYLVKQPIRAHGPDAVDRLRDGFASSEFNVRELLVSIAAEATEPEVAPAAE